MFRTSDLTSWTCSSRPFICARALSSAGLGRAQIHSRALITTKKCLRICSCPIVQSWFPPDETQVAYIKRRALGRFTRRALRAPLPHRVRIVRKHDLLSPTCCRDTRTTRANTVRWRDWIGGPAVIEPRPLRPETLRRHLSVGLPLANPKALSDVFIGRRRHRTTSAHISNTRQWAAARD